MNKIIFVLIALVVVAGIGILITRNDDVAVEGVLLPNASTTVATPTSGARSTTTESTGPSTSPSSSSVINLSGRGLSSVPADTFAKKGITTLDLSNNKLTGSLPGEVRFMQSLTALDLSDNQFSGVPAEIGQLTNLEILDLSNNSITGLPQELGNLRSLQKLDLRGNEYSVTDLAAIKQHLPSLVEVLVD